jgi:protocatechuate 3,4-dioxygenase beta subunit
MKVLRLPLLMVAVACLALLALRYSPGMAGSGESVKRGPGNAPPAATGVPSADQGPAAGTSTAALQADAQTTPKPAGGLWQGLMSWVGLSAWQGKDSSASSRQPKQDYVGAPPHLPNRGGIESRSAYPPSISGRVLDETGQPLPGIEISAEPLALFEVPQGARGSEVVAQARSGEAGAYRFEQLPKGEYRIRTIPTALYLPAEMVVRTGVDSADLVLSGGRQLSVQGQVKDVQGTPLEGVRVVSAQTPSPEAFTNHDGAYRLEIPVTPSDRNYALKFQLKGYREESSQLSDNQLCSQGTVQLDAVLTPVTSLAVVAGKVSNREGAPLGGEIVYLLGLARYQAVTNQAGEFIMADVEAGQSYRLQVPARSPYRPYMIQVQVGTEGLLQDVVLDVGSPESGPLSGRMMDAAGSPLPRFSLWLQSNNPAARWPVQVTSDDTGRYFVDEVPLGSLSLMTRSQPRFLISGIVLPEGGAENVDLILDWGSYDVTGQVVDHEGKPVPAARVVLFRSYENGGVLSQSERETTTDSGGFFRFAQVGPSVHSIRVSIPGFGSARLEYDVGPNAASVVVRLETDAQTRLYDNLNRSIFHNTCRAVSLLPPTSQTVKYKKEARC